MEPEEWREVERGVFVRGAESHRCGPGCDAPTIRIAGVECCVVSRMQMGSAVSSADEEAELPARRGRAADPMDSQGAGYKREAEDIYRKLFSGKLASADYADELRRALKQAKDRGVDLQAKAKDIVREVKHEHITLKELEPTTELASRFAPVLENVDFEAVLCAVLGYQSTHGLRYNAVVLVAPSDKIKRLIPPTRAFTKFGLRPALVKIGMNAIAENVEELASLGALVMHDDLPPPFVFVGVKRRIKI